MRKASTVHNFGTIEDAAQYVGVHTKTIRRAIAAGRLTGYRLPGSRLIRVDMNELDAVMSPIPTAGGGPNAAA
jgi:excisionase family DNA binding protein